MQETQKTPLQIKGNYKPIYGNFGYRFAASFLDGIVMIPIVFLVVYFNSLQLYNFYYTFFASQIFILWYYLYLPVKYGATPGKAMMNLIIITENANYIGYKESFLKHLPAFFISILNSVFTFLAISQANSEDFASLGWLAQTKYLQSFFPVGIAVQMGMTYVFYFANLLFFLLSARKQSIGDWLASTVVVHQNIVDEVIEFTKNTSIKSES